MPNRRQITPLLVAAVAGLAALTAPPARATPPIYTVLFTHIEDTTPIGTLGSAQSRANYQLYRGRLVALAGLARNHNIPWTLQPDWKILQAALLYEDAALMASTNGKNFLRYLKEDLGVVIDAHSHESGGYNYTDVVHLLDSLGVGTTTVIGGHVWDPALPQFAEWDRFRVPVPGERYPWALWRGDILMGSGTPNHFDDPVVSGVWRPRDRYHYFEDDSTANIAAIGQYRGTLSDIPELLALYQNGTVPTNCMLTSSYHLKPSAIVTTGGLAALEDTVLVPLAALRDAGAAVPTDFTSLVNLWRSAFGARGFLYDAEAVSAVPDGAPTTARLAVGGCAPNPFASATTVRYALTRDAHVRLAVFDARGRQLGLLVDEAQSAGEYSARWEPGGLANGIYFFRLQEVGGGRGAAPMLCSKVVLLR